MLDITLCNTHAIFDVKCYLFFIMLIPIDFAIILCITLLCNVYAIIQCQSKYLFLLLCIDLLKVNSFVEIISLNININDNDNKYHLLCVY